MWISHFLLMSFFSSYSRSDSDCVSFFTFQVSHYNPGPTVYICHFSTFSVFFAIFQVLPCEFLIFLFCEFSCHIPGPTGYISHFSRFSLFLTIFQVLQWVCLIFQFFEFTLPIPVPTMWVSHFRLSVFSPYSWSYSVCVSFSTFSIFLALFQVLTCTFLIFHIFPRLSLYTRSYHASFSFSLLVSFLTIFQVLQCAFLIFLIFHIFSVSFHIPAHTVCVSHFPRFLVFSP